MNPTKKILSIIAQARGIEDMVRPEYPNGVPKTVGAMLDRLANACDAAFDAWPMRLKPRDLKKIGDVYGGADIEAMERPSEYCTYVLYLLTDVLSYIKDERRRERLESIMAAVRAIHRYYDRRIDKDDDYLFAMDTGEQFLEMISA